MKFVVMMKDPDGVYDSIMQAATESLESIPDLSPNEREALLETRIDTIKKTTSKFFEYGEYVRIEIDTDAGTAVVLRVCR